MIPRSPLDDPKRAAYVWARYRRLMRGMMLITIVMVIGAVVMIYRENGLISPHAYIVAALGVGFAMLALSALMGLVFLPRGAGQDSAAGDPQADDIDP